MKKKNDTILITIMLTENKCAVFQKYKRNFHMLNRKLIEMYLTSCG